MTSLAPYKANQRVPGIFDGISATRFTYSGFCSSTANIFGMSSGPVIESHDFEIHPPCTVSVEWLQIGVRTEDEDTNWEWAPNEFFLYGSNDGSSWGSALATITDLPWSASSKMQSVYISDTNTYSKFKLQVNRIKKDGVGHLCIEEISFVTRTSNDDFLKLPPKDIGRGDTWIKDASVQYNNLDSYYMNYEGALYPGEYRAFSNEAWYNENHSPAGAFDNVEGVGGDNSAPGSVWATLVPHAGKTTSTADSIVEDLGWGPDPSQVFGRTLGFPAGGTEAYSVFLFDFKRIAGDNDDNFSLGDVAFLTKKAVVKLPPPDIGHGNTWTEDSTVTFNGQNTYKTTYTRATCPGPYRIIASIPLNQNWSPPGIFDGFAGVEGAHSGFHTLTIFAPTDDPAEFIIQLPCAVSLESIQIDARKISNQWDDAPNKFDFHGSNDGVSWTSLFSTTGLSWSAEKQSQSLAITDTQTYSQFKLTVYETFRSTNTPDNPGHLVIGEISFVTRTSSNGGIRLPPKDIGKGDTWTMDTTSSSFVSSYNHSRTYYKTYEGQTCPGVYRLYTSAPQHNIYHPLSGVFDHVVGNFNDGGKNLWCLHPYLGYGSAND
uniref:F5/8 type C domain-containing protein n=1 Tax=Chromera velia CCMP2878 TaxID=1169474 RepID=A0A0G4H8D7_9ALVE|eukprot:Cvel_25110.t1-p1 / transcript=Cvel_25110.t1 / gene=Cvel_25110 / organism=Chromera_velia_CCMP2878 / gene_product=hypothetical protein / transcript_product=hypothetical protein / location=Cvel_scaffold2802:7762-10883(+) / protein_length=600 / sequence_SO=supercontig / SO=protein_coding / is_pseudo=false